MYLSRNQYFTKCHVFYFFSILLQILPLWERENIVRVLSNFCPFKHPIGGKTLRKALWCLVSCLMVGLYHIKGISGKLIETQYPGCHYNPQHHGTMPASPASQCQTSGFPKQFSPSPPKYFHWGLRSFKGCWHCHRPENGSRCGGDTTHTGTEH